MVFVVTCVISAHFLSQGTVDMTKDMEEAKLPVMNINMGDYNVNYLYGYTESMECAYLRDTLTVIGDDRKVGYAINTFGERVRNIFFEVRSIDGERLVETNEIFDYANIGDTLQGTITLKDLISKNEEYMLVFGMDTADGICVKFYTRLLWADDVYAVEKVAFVDEFCRKTFDKEDATELTKYLESNSSGDNSSFAKADIHSSLKQVTWGDLNIKRICEPRVSICELTSATGYFKVEYQVRIEKEDGPVTCNVKEYYRIRYTEDRVYLLNWERECNQIFDEHKNITDSEHIDIGIMNSDINISESEGGNIFAFASEGKLIAVNPSEGKSAVLYTFYTDDINDIRTTHMEHQMRVLSVDETGNVIFIVYGYFNRGIHEGRVGLSVYEYNSATNTTEEKGFVGYSRSAQILMNDISELSYADRDGNVYFMLERNVYEMNPKEKNISLMAGNLQDDVYKVSDSGRMVVWQNEGGKYDCTKLRLMNLTSGISEDIKAGYGEYILPLGFMQEDLVYGVAKSKDVTMDQAGNMVFPMYKLIIRSDLGDILKEYMQDGIYVTACELGEAQINLTRVKYNEKSGLYEETTNDQIISMQNESSSGNVIKKIVTEELETTLQISLQDKFSDGNIAYQTPKEIMYEGSREIERASSENWSCLYVYGLKGYDNCFVDAGNAINYAYGISGIVVNGDGDYIWTKTTRAYKNQIMAITAPDKVDTEYSIAECVDAMLRLEGVTTNSRVLLSQGRSAQQILEEYLGDASILNLAGCNLDTVLYYVNKDIPVLVVLNNSTSYLVTGFNDSQIVLYDPSKGELHKESTTECDNLFKQNGYKFITYLR